MKQPLFTIFFLIFSTVGFSEEVSIEQEQTSQEILIEDAQGNLIADTEGIVYNHLTAANPDEPHSMDPSTQEVKSAFIRMMVVLLIVILLAAVSIYFFKKLMSNRITRGSYGQSIKILERRAISPKSLLYLVEVDGKKTLISESQVEVRKLESFEEEKKS